MQQVEFRFIELIKAKILSSQCSLKKKKALRTGISGVSFTHHPIFFLSFILGRIFSVPATDLPRLFK